MQCGLARMYSQAIVFHAESPAACDDIEPTCSLYSRIASVRLTRREDASCNAGYAKLAAEMKDLIIFTQITRNCFQSVSSVR